LPCRTFQVQNRRNPLRCQPITVSGLTMASAERQSPQTRERITHKKRSTEVKRGRVFAPRCRIQICRSARISNSKAARYRNRDATAASKGRMKSIEKALRGRRTTLIISNRSEFTIGTRARFRGEPAQNRNRQGADGNVITVRSVRHHRQHHLRRILLRMVHRVIRHHALCLIVVISTGIQIPIKSRKVAT